MAKITANEKLLDAALDLILAQGYAATTVDMICEKAGVSKGSCYHFFASKEELVLAVLTRYYDARLQLLMNGEFANLSDPLARALGFLDRTEAMSADLWQRGCLLGTLVNDLAMTHPHIRKQISEMFENLIEGLATIFAPFVESLESSDRPTPRELAEHYLVIIEGSIVLGRAYRDPSRIPHGLRQFKRYLAGAAAGSH